jgi:hypothetical protein
VTGVVSCGQRRTNKTCVLQGRTAIQFIKSELTKARFIQQVETQKLENISYDISLLVLIDFANTAVIQGTTSFPGFFEGGKTMFFQVENHSPIKIEIIKDQLKFNTHHTTGVYLDIHTLWLYCY